MPAGKNINFVRNFGKPFFLVSKWNGAVPVDMVALLEHWIDPALLLEMRHFGLHNLASLSGSYISNF
jgi:hypothetical protein